MLVDTSMLIFNMTWNHAIIRDGLTRKNCCFFGFCPNEGGRATVLFFYRHRRHDGVHIWLVVKRAFVASQANHVGFMRGGVKTQYPAENKHGRLFKCFLILHCSH